MKKARFGIVAAIAAVSLAFTGCTNADKTQDAPTASAPAAETSAPSEAATVELADGVAKAKLNPVDADGKIEVTDAHGTQKITPNPSKVVLLDNRTFETLEDWGIKPVAIPKKVTPSTIGWKSDDSVQDVGNHREPNYDVITAADPDFVLVGQRFAQHYDDIKAAAPNAEILDLNVDLPAKATDPKAGESGQILVDGLAQDVLTLGQIFGHEADAAKLINDLNASIENARAGYKQGTKVLSVNTSGGKIGFLDPDVGRVYGPLYNLLGWEPALSLESGTNDHKGDEISEEAIAQANPDWIMILDRDAAVGDSDKKKDGEAKKSVPGRELVETSQALSNVTAVKEGNIYVAPADTYTNEGIQTFIEIFNDLAKLG
ncbi:siderophore ABC transporter substrate-binding protein [Actinobaculum suis]|uniref:siderophore ABC transporter substrate-binding protein n=1 Tax=Actinobaculum suis TaxID=1657 RepID=UPI0008087A8D|nr:ABC transporter substrate-binding protein [Actinobaculum suis]OCA94870.1 iron ABC transporter substrate-binding protein [Actinobaculum suis]OCA95458.1 iron ABC transporter substrate-binding protein [Actinobaculum suis]